MRPLTELLDTTDPAWPLIQQWIRAATNPVEVLPPSDARADALLETQVTTHSPMGAIVYETGGLLIDHAFLRILGSGHPRLPRSLPDWNKQIFNADANLPFYLIADDAIGGFYALNGGTLGSNPRNVYYFAPDTLRWDDLGHGYTDFLLFALQGDLAGFYESVRWPGWEQEVARLSGDESFQVHPLLITREARDPSNWSKRVIPTRDLYHLYVDTLAPQLANLKDDDQFTIRLR